jgi:four helix bundle protein
MSTAVRTIRDFRDLDVWRKAMDLAAACYKVGEQLPRSETYGLRSQLQRAAVSVPANIAEGSGRLAPRDYIRHLAIANGSLLELTTHLELTKRLALVDRRRADEALALAGDVGRMLRRLMKVLSAKL